MPKTDDYEEAEVRMYRKFIAKVMYLVCGTIWSLAIHKS